MNICIYGAASADIDKKYMQQCEQLGYELAKNGNDLVFGAGGNGMMGAAARGFKRGGAKVVGVVPKFFNVDGILFDGCDELIRPDTMRERKRIMDERADAFIVTPGGIGTFEEFFEIYTLRQLGQSEKALVVFDIDGYYTDIRRQLEKCVEGNFMKQKSVDLVKYFGTVDEIVEYLDGYRPEHYSILETRSIEN